MARKSTEGYRWEDSVYKKIYVPEAVTNLKKQGYTVKVIENKSSGRPVYELWVKSLRKSLSKSKGRRNPPAEIEAIALRAASAINALYEDPEDGINELYELVEHYLTGYAESEEF